MCRIPQNNNMNNNNNINNNSNLMSFEAFCEAVQQDVKQVLEEKTGEVFNVSPAIVDKLQGEGYSGLRIGYEGSDISASINMKPFFERYTEGTGYDSVVSELAAYADRSLEKCPSFVVQELTEYERMKEHLIMQVVSTANNAEMLSGLPHKEIEDMSIVYRFLVTVGENDEGSILVTNKLLRTMGVSPEQVIADAEEYAPVNHPAEIRSMAEILAEMAGLTVDEFNDVYGDGIPMRVASNITKLHGASVIAYPGFMEKAAEEMGGDFYILPSSIHEVILVPDDGNMDTSAMIEMVSSVNATQVAPCDRLTDNVYHYSCAEKSFKRVGENSNITDINSKTNSAMA